MASGPGRSRAEGTDGATRRRRDAFPAFCGAPSEGRRGALIGAVVHSPRRGRRGEFVPLGPSSANTVIRARPPRRVATARACTAQTRSGTTSATSSAGRRPTSSSTSGSSRSSSPRSAATPSTCARPSTSAPRSPSATCPLLRRAASSRFDAHALGRGRRRRLGAAGRGRAGGDPAARPLGRRTGARGDRLNPKYTFEQFVIGDGNRFAHAAALAVAELPGQSYNPLFLHGSPGHRQDAPPPRHRQLRRALTARACRSATRRSRSSRPSSSRPCGGSSTADFKQRFRGADVVLIDDVQFLAGRDKTREEFFHTFNALLDSGRQLVHHLRPRARRTSRASRTRLIERFGRASSSSSTRPSSRCAWRSSPSAPGWTTSRCGATCSPRSRAA